MQAKPKKDASHRKSIERQVGELERHLTPKQREAYVKLLLMVEQDGGTVTAERQLEWLEMVTR